MQTIFDPKAARYFADVLDKQSADLRSHNTSICKSALELNVNWRDRKYDVFFKQFEDATKKLAEFLEQSEKYSKYLKTKAGIVDRYHGR